MTLHLNRVELIARLGQDPDLRYTQTGQAVATFSVATDRPTKPNGESITDWHQCVCWDKLAEFTNQYLTKGRLVSVSSDRYCQSQGRSPPAPRKP